MLEAELAAETADIAAAEFADLTSDDDAVLCDAIDRHLIMLVEWARHLSSFLQVPLSDQVILLRSGWPFQRLIGCIIRRAVKRLTATGPTCHMYYFQMDGG